MLKKCLIVFSLIAATAFSQTQYKNLNGEQWVVTDDVLKKDTATEVIVDAYGRGDFSSISQACAYADSVHATNANLELSIRIAAGTYYEHPVLNLPRTILRGDSRRSKLWGSLTIKANPTYISGMYLRSNAAGETPVVFQDVSSSTLGTFSDCYVLNAITHGGTSYCFMMTNSPNAQLNIVASEFYSQNTSTDPNAKSVCIFMDGGILEMVNDRLKTTSASDHVYENEWMAWMSGASQIQMENTHYLCIHDINPKAKVDGTAGILWIESTAIGSYLPDNLMKFEGSSATPVIYYTKETGTFDAHGDATVSRNMNASNFNVVVNGTTNHVPVFISSLSDATGFTTQQIWKVGGSNVTNFFSRSSGCPYQWRRPSYWPIDSAYNASTWIEPESNKVKMVLQTRRSSVNYCYIDVKAGYYTVSWGDGTTNIYNSDVAISHIYTNYDYAAVVVTATSGFNRVVLNGYPYCPHELITAKEMTTISDSSLYNCNIKSLIGEFTTATYRGAFENDFWLENLVLNKLTNLDPANLDSHFKNCIRLKYVSMNNLQSFGWAAFLGCYELQEISLPSVTTMNGEAVFNTCTSLRYVAPMTNLTSCPLPRGGNGDTFLNDSLGLTAITNFVLSLPTCTTPGGGKMSFAGNPGALDALAWYTDNNFSVSNSLALKNWFFYFN